MHSAFIRTALPIIAAAALATACGGTDQSGSEIDSSADLSDTSSMTAPAAAPSADAAETDSARAAITAADIDLWQKGMEAELQAVRDAGTQLRNAKSGTDSLSALSAANEMSTLAAGAVAAGVDEERYRRIRSTLSPVVAQLSPLELEMDVSKMPATMVAEMKKAREEGLARVTSELPPELVEALRPRAAALRKQELALTGERLKAAGMAR